MNKTQAEANAISVETTSDDEVEVLVEGKNDDHDLLSPGADAWAEGAYALHRRITKRFDDAESPWIYLDKMYVRPRSQRQGLATALWCEGPLKEAEARLQSERGGSDGVNVPLPVLTVSVGSSIRALSREVSTSSIGGGDEAYSNASAVSLTPGCSVLSAVRT